MKLEDQVISRVERCALCEEAATAANPLHAYHRSIPSDTEPTRLTLCQECLGAYLIDCARGRYSELRRAIETIKP